MTRRKTPPAKPSLPREGGSFICEKGGALVPELVPERELGAEAADAPHPEHRREHRRQPAQLREE